MPDQSNKNKYMQEALKLARKAASLGEAPIGAVVVYKDRIIGRGWNTRESKGQITGHAELMALTKACNRLKTWKLNDCDIYVTLEPCYMCIGAIQQARIRQIFVGTLDAKGGSLLSNLKFFEQPKLNHYCQYEVGICQKECSDILKTFFRELRQQKALAKQIMCAADKSPASTQKEI